MTNIDQHQSPPSVSTSRLDADKAGRLLAAVAAVANSRLSLSECRTEILTQLLVLTESAGGMWAWGVADEPATAPAPVASISVGLTASEQAAVIQMGLAPSMYEEMRIPAMKRNQGRSQFTTLRTHLWDDRQWKSTQMFADCMAGGFGEWLHSVRLNGLEPWSSLWMMRRIGKPPFLSADQQLIDLAMTSIPWLGATLDSALPIESCVALTSRQRIVLMMQLDGLSRKEIANRLQVSVDTVGDHLKKIYEQFGIQSTGELAALFLRNR